MNNFFIKFTIGLRNKFLLKNIFDFLEFFLCFLSKFISNENKIFSIFQVFSGGQLISRLRFQKSKLLVNTKDRILENINQKSYCYLGKIDSHELINAKNYFLNQKKIYNSHIPNVRNNNEILMKDFNQNESSNYGSYDIKTSVNCPNLEKICNKFKFKELSQKYLNSKNTKVYSINTMLSKKTNNQHGVTKLHRDFDSSNSIVFFIYWTKVSKNDGATSLLPGSHLYAHDKNFHKGFKEFDKLEYLEGEEGSIFCLDTWSYHRGNPKINTNRLATWVRFTAVPAKTYFLDENFLFQDSLNKFNHKLI